MNTIGFPIPRKENENRRAILPNDIATLAHPNHIYIEKGYGKILNIDDNAYAAKGATITTLDEILKKDIICDPKIGSANYIDCIHDNTVLGWIHAVQGREITDKLITNRLTAYAWEDMFEEDGKHTFSRNNELAGEAAIRHALDCHPFDHTPNAAILGRGNTARGAIKMLKEMDIPYQQFTRNDESEFHENLFKFDIIVCAILWDIFRKDHIITRNDLYRLPPNALIIDIACDKSGAIETSIPTTIDNPCYVIDGVTHYVVDHTPTLVYKDATESISKALCPHLDSLIEGKPDKCMQKALIINHGIIIDQRINRYQTRNN